MTHSLKKPGKPGGKNDIEYFGLQLRNGFMISSINVVGFQEKFMLVEVSLRLCVAGWTEY